MSYRWEKFFEAVNTLASGSGSIHERLFNAVAYNNLSGLNRYFPEKDLREKYIDLMNELTEEEPIGNEGSVKATINKMTPEKASELATKIVSMFNKICKIDYYNRKR